MTFSRQDSWALISPAPDLASLLPSWLVTLRAAGRSPQTIKVYIDGVGSLLRFCEQTGAVARLDRPTVSAWLAHMLDIGGAPSSARTRHHAVKRFSAWLALEGETSADELAGMALPAADVKVTDPLTDLELRDLIRVCAGPAFPDRRDEAIVRLMAETGIRAGECAALALADVDVVRGTAIVRRGKGGRGRVVPFGAATAAAIDKYVRMRRVHRLAHTEALWVGDRGKTFAYHSLHRALLRRARMAGIDRFHPHLLRHTYATRWLAAGGSEGGLMAVAGWRKREMLDRYTAATAAERAAAEARRLGLGEL